MTATNTPAPGPSDLDAVLPFFTEATAAYLDLVRRAAAFEWSGPGLGAWDLRSLIGHTSRSLITVETYLERPAPRATLPDAASYYRTIATGVGTDAAAVDERGRAAGRAMGADPLRFATELADRVVARVRSIAAAGEDPVLTSIAGPIALSDYLPTRSFELVVHGFDIAAAAELSPPTYSRPLLNHVVTLATELAVGQGNGRMVLLTLTGRTRLSPGFSVV